MLNCFTKINFLLWGPLEDLINLVMRAIYGLYFGLIKAIAWVLDMLTQLYFIFAGMTPVSSTTINSADGKAADIDIVNFFLTQKTFQKAYLYLCLVALGLIIVFTIAKIIKQDYFDRSGPRSKGPIFRNVALSFIAFICVIPIFYFLIDVAAALALLVMQAMGYKGGGIGTLIFNICWDDGGDSIRTIAQALGNIDVVEFGSVEWDGLNDLIPSKTYDPDNFGWYSGDTFFAYYWDRDALSTVNRRLGGELEVVKFHWYIFIFTGFILIVNIGQMMIAMVTRMYNLIALFIVAPSPISQIVLDDGHKFKQWKDHVIQEALKVVGNVMCFMIFIMIVGVVDELDLMKFAFTERAASSLSLIEDNNLTTELSNSISAMYYNDSEVATGFDKAINSLGRCMIIIAGLGAIKDMDVIVTKYISGGSPSMEMGAAGKAVTNAGKLAAKGALDIGKKGIGLATDLAAAGVKMGAGLAGKVMEAGGAGKDAWEKIKNANREDEGAGDSGGGNGGENNERAHDENNNNNQQTPTDERENNNEEAHNENNNNNQQTPEDENNNEEAKDETGGGGHGGTGDNEENEKTPEQIAEEKVDAFKEATKVEREKAEQYEKAQEREGQMKDIEKEMEDVKNSNDMSDEEKEAKLSELESKHKELEDAGPSVEEAKEEWDKAGEAMQAAGNEAIVALGEKDSEKNEAIKRDVKRADIDKQIKELGPEAKLGKYGKKKLEELKKQKEAIKGPGLKDLNSIRAQRKKASESKKKRDDAEKVLNDAKDRSAKIDELYKDKNAINKIHPKNEAEGKEKQKRLNALQTEIDTLKEGPSVAEAQKNFNAADAAYRQDSRELETMKKNAGDESVEEVGTRSAQSSATGTPVPADRDSTQSAGGVANSGIADSGVKGGDSGGNNNLAGGVPIDMNTQQMGSAGGHRTFRGGYDTSGAGGVGPAGGQSNGNVRFATLHEHGKLGAVAKGTKVTLAATGALTAFGSKLAFGAAGQALKTGKEVIGTTAKTGLSVAGILAKTVLGMTGMGGVANMAGDFVGDVATDTINKTAALGKELKQKGSEFIKKNTKMVDSQGNHVDKNGNRLDASGNVMKDKDGNVIKGVGDPTYESSLGKAIGATQKFAGNAKKAVGDFGEYVSRGGPITGQLRYASGVVDRASRERVFIEDEKKEKLNRMENAGTDLVAQANDAVNEYNDMGYEGIDFSSAAQSASDGANEQLANAADLNNLSENIGGKGNRNTELDVDGDMAERINHAYETYQDTSKLREKASAATNLYAASIRARQAKEKYDRLTADGSGAKQSDIDEAQLEVQAAVKDVAQYSNEVQKEFGKTRKSMLKTSADNEARNVGNENFERAVKRARTSVAISKSKGKISQKKADKLNNKIDAMESAGQASYSDGSRKVTAGRSGVKGTRKVMNKTLHVRARSGNVQDATSSNPVPDRIKSSGGFNSPLTPAEQEQIFINLNIIEEEELNQGIGGKGLIDMRNACVDYGRNAWAGMPADADNFMKRVAQVDVSKQFSDNRIVKGIDEIKQESLPKEFSGSVDDYKRMAMDRYEGAVNEYNSSMERASRLAKEYATTKNPEMLKAVQQAIQQAVSSSEEIRGLKLELNIDEKN